MYRMLLVALIVLAALWAVADLDARIIKHDGRLTVAVGNARVDAVRR
jgi:hypothetical protein